jgi:hypothetical protein
MKTVVLSLAVAVATAGSWITRGAARATAASAALAAQTEPDPNSPHPDLQSLKRLVGTWKLSGEIDGRVTYEWMEGGFFLLQRFDFERQGRRIKGLEVIGHERPFGAEPSEEIKSRAFDSLGNTLDYVYELQGDVLTIWGGKKGSPAHFKGRFSRDGRTCTGGWIYPGGGGYSSTMTRVD